MFALLYYFSSILKLLELVFLELGTFVLATHNSDCLIPISAAGTFNLRFNAQSLHFIYHFRVQLYLRISTNVRLNLEINKQLLSSVSKNPNADLIIIIIPSPNSLYKRAINAWSQDSHTTVLASELLKVIHQIFNLYIRI